MKLTQSSFRDIFHSFCFISYEIKQPVSGEGGIEVPEEANAVLVYPYIDRTAGLSLDVVAPAKMPECEIFCDYALIDVQNRRFTIRAGALDEFDLVVADDQEELRRRFAKHCDIIDTYYLSEGTAATREIEVIDHLRHKDYPDDVEVALFSEEGSYEIVWVRLEAVERDEDSGTGYLVGELLNQPYGEYEAVMGDLMALGLTKDDEGTFRLFTRDAMIVNPRGRKRLEEFQTRREEGSEQGGGQ